MEIMVYSLFWVMQDLYHQPQFELGFGVMIGSPKKYIGVIPKSKLWGSRALKGGVGFL